MAEIHVNPARLAAAAEAIGTASQGIDDALAQLVSTAALLGHAWSGQAQSAFAHAHRRFDASMTSRAALVDAVASALDDLAHSYSAADLAGQRALGGG